MARQVAGLLDRTYAWVRQIMHEHVLAVGAVALMLLERGVLDGKDVEAIVREHSPPQPGKRIGGESEG